MDSGSGERFRPVVPLASRLLRALPIRTAKTALQEMAQAAAAGPVDPAGAGDMLQGWCINGRPSRCTTPGPRPRPSWRVWP